MWQARVVRRRIVPRLNSAKEPSVHHHAAGGAASAHRLRERAEFGAGSVDAFEDDEQDFERWR